MTVLANALSAADTVMNLGSALDVGNFPAPYTIGSEAILVTGGDNTTSPSIIRGQNGTASAAHAAGASLTSGWGGGSGSISATDGSTTVNPATTLQFPVGTLADLGGGTAQMASPVRAAVFTLEANNAEDGSGHVLWDTVYDVDGTVIGNPPALSGLSLGPSGYGVVATEPGIWSWSLVWNPNSDVTALASVFITEGHPDVAGGLRIYPTSVNAASYQGANLEFCLSDVVVLNVGQDISVNVAADGATTPGYKAWAYGTMKVVRFI